MCEHWSTLQSVRDVARIFLSKNLTTIFNYLIAAVNVEVLVLQNEEKVISADGGTLNLVKDSRMFILLADAEPLIEKGIVKQIQWT